MSYLRTIGDNISLAMKQIGMSIESLSDSAGLSVYDLRRVIEGRLMLSADELSRIAVGLNTTVADLRAKRPQGDYSGLIHCMGHCNNLDNRDKILDYIDFYIGIQEAKS